MLRYFHLQTRTVIALVIETGSMAEKATAQELGKQRGVDLDDPTHPDYARPRTPSEGGPPA